MAGIFAVAAVGYAILADLKGGDVPNALAEDTRPLEPFERVTDPVALETVTDTDTLPTRADVLPEPVRATASSASSTFTAAGSAPIADAAAPNFGASPLTTEVGLYIDADQGYVRADQGYVRADQGYVRADQGYVRADEAFHHASEASVIEIGEFLDAD